MTTVSDRRQPLFPPFTEWVDAFALLGGWNGRGPLPGIRVEELVEDDAFVVRAELPGLDPARDIDVSLEGGVLTIHAERHEDAPPSERSEFRYGALARRIRLPRGASDERASATYRDGVLTVRVPVEASPWRIHHVPVVRG